MCGVDEPILPTHDPNGVEPYKTSTGSTHSGSDEKRWLSCDPPVFNRRLTRCDPCRVETIPSISWSTLRLYMGIRQFIDYQIIGGEQKQDGLKGKREPQTTPFLAHHDGKKITSRSGKNHITMEIFFLRGASTLRITVRFFFLRDGFLATPPKA